MARISAKAAISTRVGIGHKKGAGSHDGISPGNELGIERDVSDDLTDEELADRAEQMYLLLRKRSEKYLNEDLKDLRKRGD